MRHTGDQLSILGTPPVLFPLYSGHPWDTLSILGTTSGLLGTLPECHSILVHPEDTLGTQCQIVCLSDSFKMICFTQTRVPTGLRGLQACPTIEWHFASILEPCAGQKSVPTPTPQEYFITRTCPAPALDWCGIPRDPALLKIQSRTRPAPTSVALRDPTGSRRLSCGIPQYPAYYIVCPAISRTLPTISNCNITCK
jgi:hypothetical protein